MQYGYKLDMGRIGCVLEIFKLDGAADELYTWKCTFNSKGIEASRVKSDGVEVALCQFDTLLYPDNIEEDELLFIDVLSGAPVEEDHDVLRLCSLLVAKWAAGHTEESFHDTIRDTLKKWSEG